MCGVWGHRFFNCPNSRAPATDVVIFFGSEGHMENDCESVVRLESCFIFQLSLSDNLVIYVSAYESTHDDKFEMVSFPDGTLNVNVNGSEGTTFYVM